MWLGGCQLIRGPGQGRAPARARAGLSGSWVTPSDQPHLTHWYWMLIKLTYTECWSCRIDTECRSSNTDTECWSSHTDTKFGSSPTYTECQLSIKNKLGFKRVLIQNIIHLILCHYIALNQCKESPPVSVSVTHQSINCNLGLTLSAALLNCGWLLIYTQLTSHTQEEFQFIYQWCNHSSLNWALFFTVHGQYKCMDSD